MPKNKKNDYLLVDSLEEFNKLSEEIIDKSHDMLKLIVRIDNIAYDDDRTNYKNFEKESNELRKILLSYKDGKIRHIYSEPELEKNSQGVLKEIYDEYLSKREKIVTNGHITGKLVGIGADILDTYWLIETEDGNIGWCSCVGAIKPI